MAKYPSTSISISFVTELAGDLGEDDAILQAEIVSEDNGGRTNFILGGAAPKFRLYKSPNVKDIKIFVSDGDVPQVVQANIKSEDFVDALTFAGAAGVDDAADADKSYNTATVGKPVYYPPTITQIKGNIGSVSLVLTGFTTFKCSGVSSGPLDPVVGFCRVTYNSKYDMYELTGVSTPEGFGEDGFDEYTVVVYIVGVVG